MDALNPAITIAGRTISIDATALDLSKQHLTDSDLPLLRCLTNLTKLELGFTQISDVGVLAGLTNLQELHLTGNAISDVSALVGLTNLTKLSLFSPPLDRTQIDALKAALPNCRIDFTFFWSSKLYFS